MDVYGLIGNPVGHSHSPPMQEAGFEAADIDARYVTFELAADRGREAIEAASVLGLRGLNVTIPFKEQVLAAVEPDDMAAAVGAVNTVDLRSDPPRGYNTDVEGAIRALSHHDVTIEDARAVVVGAGGAGRGIAFGLAGEGAQVAIANRTVERARAIADELPSVSAHGLDELETLIDAADILVQATSVGMESDESVVPAGALHSDLAVMDAVYQPLETRLLREADRAGARTIDGAWMLLYQGVGAFERWTEAEAPIEAMDRALRESLKNR